MNSPSQLAAASERDFERLVEPYRRELHAHCYRMLGSLHDAEDALQDTLLRAWRGLPAFEGRSSLRSWLYRIATNSCLRLIERRPKRMLPTDHGPAADPHDVPGSAASEPIWIEPYPDERLVADEALSPEARYEQRESVELAFIAALQNLPARQRAVLILRDVLGFSGAEVAETLEASPASVYSALQRAHKAVEERLPDRSQQRTMRSLGDAEVGELVERFVAAWEGNDVEAIRAMLIEDATFAMPPQPAWFRGREAIAGFLARFPLSTMRRWRLVPARASGQAAFAAYAWSESRGVYRAESIEVLGLSADGRIAEITAFRDPELLASFGLPAEIAP